MRCALTFLLVAACASSKPAPSQSTVVDVPDASASEPAAEERVDGELIHLGDIGSSQSSTLDRNEIRRVVRTWVPKLSACYERELNQDPMLVVRTWVPKLSACYERELNQDPMLVVKAVPRFVIAPDGKVSSAELTPSTGIAQLDQCLVQTFLQMQFPPPAGGGSVTVSYPLNFQPAP